MSIFRTNNPLAYDEVDGIVIDEQAPAPQVQAVGTGTVILVGQFQRGTHELTRISSLQALHEEFGKSNSLGNIQLKNKAFSVLKVIRVEPTGADKASLTVADAAGAIVITDTNTGAVLGVENYASPADLVAKIATSKLVTAEIVDGDLTVTALHKGAYGNSITVKVGVAAAAPLTGGDDGAVADSDYEDAIEKANVEGAGNIIFLDQYNEVRNALLKTHVAATQDKMAILSCELGDSVADVVTAVATLRDADGRLIYAYNWVKTLVDGVATLTSPASWLASIMSQTSPNVDPAYAGNTQFLAGVIGLEKNLSRDEYKQLKEAGISAFEQDLDIGFKLKSGIVTQIANSEKVTILRRRMADYLTNSVGKFLKVYQNDVNSEPKRIAVQAAIKSFITGQENLGILPKDKEVIGGRAKLVDIKSENTNESIAAGKFIILYKQRIYSSMRYIVLKAEIGQSVVVTEQE